MMKFILIFLTLSFALGEEMVDTNQVVEESSPFVREKRQMGYSHPGYGGYDHGHLGMYDQAYGMNHGLYGANNMYNHGGFGSRGGMSNQQVDPVHMLAMMDHRGRFAENFQKQILPPLGPEMHDGSLVMPNHADTYLPVHPYLMTDDHGRSAEPVVSYILSTPYRVYGRRHYEPYHY